MTNGPTTFHAKKPTGALLELLLYRNVRVDVGADRLTLTDLDDGRRSEIPWSDVERVRFGYRWFRWGKFHYLRIWDRRSSDMILLSVDDDYDYRHVAPLVAARVAAARGPAAVEVGTSWGDCVIPAVMAGVLIFMTLAGFASGKLLTLAAVVLLIPLAAICLYFWVFPMWPRPLGDPARLPRFVPGDGFWG